MGFKKISGNETEAICDLKIREGNTYPENWRVLEKDFPNVIRILNEKRGWGLNLKKKEEKKDTDLDWAMK